MTKFQRPKAKEGARAKGPIGAVVRGRRIRRIANSRIADGKRWAMGKFVFSISFGFVSCRLYAVHGRVLFYVRRKHERATNGWRMADLRKVLRLGRNFRFRLEARGESEFQCKTASAQRTCYASRFALMYRRDNGMCQ